MPKSIIKKVVQNEFYFYILYIKRVRYSENVD